MHLALKVQATFGGGAPVTERPRIDTQWADAETRNEVAQSQIAEAHKRLNVPDVAVWAQLGYTPEEIAEFQAIAQQARAQDVATIAAALRTQQAQPTQVQGNAQPIAASQNGNGVQQ